MDARDIQHKEKQEKKQVDALLLGSSNIESDKSEHEPIITSMQLKDEAFSQQQQKDTQLETQALTKFRQSITEWGMGLLPQSCKSLHPFPTSSLNMEV